MAIRTGVIHNRQRHHQVGVLQIGAGHRLAVGDQVYVEARHEQRHAQIGEGGGHHMHWLGVAGDEERPVLRPGATRSSGASRSVFRTAVRATWVICSSTSPTSRASSGVS
jgi:hypothetical protein